MPINPKEYSCYGPQKNSHKEFDNAKNSCGSKFPPPPPKATFCFSFCFQSFAQLINSAIY